MRNISSRISEIGDVEYPIEEYLLTKMRNLLYNKAHINSPRRNVISVIKRNGLNKVEN